MSKAWTGNFFEDFRIGQRLVHATPRTVTEGERALYVALTGSRFALSSSDEFARACGLPAAPLDDLLVSHVAFGKTVPDLSLNAIANLGYAELVFGQAVYPGDTLATVSEVIGLKQASSGDSGIVWVRSTCRNQRDEVTLEWVRWVLVRKRDNAAPAPETAVPKLAAQVAPETLALPALRFGGYDFALAGSPHRWGDYAAGETIDHLDGMTLEEAEHQLATRLYQNTARVHFDQAQQKASRFGRRLVYGGVVISLARALTFNGLGNAQRVLAINAGTHANPCFAGDTLYAWSEVLESAPLAGRSDAGLLRLRTLALKDRPASSFPNGDPRPGPDGKRDPAVLLDLDYWVALPA